jgi:multimeric flavodoxin WrbA
MKVLAINGSMCAHGNTSILINEVFEELKKEGIDTQLIQMAGQTISGCTGCYACKRMKNNKCINDKDSINDWVAEMAKADGIILGSPVYFADMSAGLKALIERAGMVARANGMLFKRKIGAAVVAGRRGGATQTFNNINSFFTIEEMIVVGSNYWNVGKGKDHGEVSDDEEGLETMRVLGRNMAWLLKKICE